MFYGEIMLIALKTLIKFITISLPYICRRILACELLACVNLFGAGNAIIAKDAYKSVFVPHNSDVNSSSSDVNASGDQQNTRRCYSRDFTGRRNRCQQQKDKKIPIL